MASNASPPYLQSTTNAQHTLDCAPDVPHAAGNAALLTGLSSSSLPSSPKFFIQTSGAARIWDAPDGSTPGQVWDDIADIDRFPTTTTHAASDIQIFCATLPTLHTAVISPSFVVGRSPSRSHTAPIIFPYLFRVVRNVGGGFVSGEGRNVTAFVDNAVLAEMYVALVTDALRVMEGEVVNDEVWGPRGYYFAASLEVSFREFMEGYLLPALTRCGGDGLLRNDGIKEFPQEEINSLSIGKLGGVGALWNRHIAERFGTAMRVRPSRAQNYLGVNTAKGLPALDDAVKVALRDL